VKLRNPLQECCRSSHRSPGLQPRRRWASSGAHAGCGSVLGIQYQGVLHVVHLKSVPTSTETIVFYYIYGFVFEIYFEEYHYLTSDSDQFAGRVYVLLGT